MARKLGSAASINRNTGNYASPAWSFIRTAMDVKLDLQPAGVFDSSDRGVAIDTVIPTARMKAKVEFDCIWSDGDGVGDLLTHFFAGTPIEMAVLDGAAGAATAWGIRGEWAVTKFPLDFPLNDGQKLSIELQPHGNYTNAMAFYTDATMSPGAAEAVGTKQLGADASITVAAGAIAAAMDIKISMTPSGLFDSSDRGCVFDTVIPTARFKSEVEFSFLWDSSNTKLTGIRTAFLNGSPLLFTVSDGEFFSMTGDWAILGFPIEAKLREGQKITIKLQPHGNYSNVPTFSIS